MSNGAYFFVFFFVYVSFIGLRLTKTSLTLINVVTENVPRTLDLCSTTRTENELRKTHVNQEYCEENTQTGRKRGMRLSESHSYKKLTFSRASSSPGALDVTQKTGKRLSQTAGIAPFYRAGSDSRCVTDAAGSVQDAGTREANNSGGQKSRRRH